MIAALYFVAFFMSIIGMFVVHDAWEDRPSLRVIVFAVFDLLMILYWLGQFVDELGITGT